MGIKPYSCVGQSLKFLSLNQRSGSAASRRRPVGDELWKFSAPEMNCLSGLLAGGGVSYGFMVSCWLWIGLTDCSSEAKRVQRVGVGGDARCLCWGGVVSICHY